MRSGGATQPGEKLAIAAAIAWLGWQLAVLLNATWPVVVDDAYITLRYARNWVEGAGLVWNAGESPPVEGYSNFLFVALGAAVLDVSATGASSPGSELGPIQVFQWLNAGALVGTLALLMRMVAWHAPAWLVLLPGILLLQLRGTIWWTTSGLETATFQFLGCLAIYLFCRAYRSSPEVEPKRPLALLAGAGLLVALASMLRPEGPLVGVAMAAAWAVDLLRTRVAKDNAGERLGPAVKRQVLSTAVNRAAAMGLAFALPYGFYFAWRMAYYGRWLPHSVECKAAYSGDAMALVGPFLGVVWPALLASLFLGRRLLQPVFSVMLFVTVLYAWALYGADPLVGEDHRHVLLAYALATVPAAAGLGCLFERLREGSSPGLARWLLPLTLLFLVAELHWRLPQREAEMRAWTAAYQVKEEARRNVAEWANQRLGPDGWLAIGDVGRVGFEGRFKIYDTYCLNTLEATDPRFLGHDEAYATHMLGRGFDIVVLSSRLSSSIVAHHPREGRLAELPAFERSYRLARVFDSAADQGFTYFAYEPRGSTLGPGDPAADLPRGGRE